MFPLIWPLKCPGYHRIFRGFAAMIGFLRVGLEFAIKLPSQLDEPTAMCSPAVTSQVCFSGFGLTVDLCGRIAVERSMKTAVVVILLECFKLPLRIDCVPE